MSYSGCGVDRIGSHVYRCELQRYMQPACPYQHLLHDSCRIYAPIASPTSKGSATYHAATRAVVCKHIAEQVFAHMHPTHSSASYGRKLPPACRVALRNASTPEFRSSICEDSRAFGKKHAGEVCCNSGLMEMLCSRRDVGGMQKSMRRG